MLILCCVPARADFGISWFSDESDLTEAVAWGDYDGDGDLDQVVGNEGGPNRVYRNDGGTFTLAWSSSESEDTFGVDWGDYDGDGLLDIAVANEQGTNRVYLNSGGDSFSSAWTSPTENDSYDVAWGDYDSDGDLDLVIANQFANILYRNSGDGDFPGGWTCSETATTYSIEWADVDGDGDQDQVAGYTGSNIVYSNEGSGSFFVLWSSTETDSTIDLTSGDYNADGYPDLLAVNTEFSTGQLNIVYSNAGDGTFTTGWTADDKDSSYGGAWGDYDGDGNLDFVVANTLQAGEPLYVFNNSGVDTFSLGWQSDETGAAVDVAWGDSDGDGDLDFLVGNYGATNTVYANNPVFTNDTPSDPTETPEPDSMAGWVTLDWAAATDTETPAAGLTYQVRVGTSPGGHEIVSGAYAPPWGNAGATTSYHVKLNVPDTYYWSVSAVDTSGFSMSGWTAEDDFILSPSFDNSWTSSGSDTTAGVAFGDYDGDGYLDVFKAKVGGANDLYENDAAGGFTIVWTTSETDSSSGVQWGDYDSDGDLDVLVASTSTFNFIYANDGGGDFSLAWSSSESETTRKAVWIDCDNDGDLDHLAANGPGVLRVYLNSGGDFTSSWTSSESDTTTYVSTVDYDGDGYRDFAVSNANTEVNRIYSNSGDCSFTAVWASTETDESYSVAWADYDADGSPDVLFGNYSGVNRIYSNDGGDNFSLAQSSSESENTNRFAWGDFDADGDFDLLSLNAGANRLYQQNPGGTFDSAWTTSETDTSLCGGFADFDGDGDLDFFAGNAGVDRLYENGIDPWNSSPSTPTASPTANATFDGSTPETIVLEWSGSTDDVTPAVQLTYHVRVGTCSGCGNVISGAFAPPVGNMGSTGSYPALRPAPGPTKFLSRSRAPARSGVTGRVLQIRTRSAPCGPTMTATLISTYLPVTTGGRASSTVPAARLSPKDGRNPGGSRAEQWAGATSTVTTTWISFPATRFSRTRVQALSLSSGRHPSRMPAGATPGAMPTATATWTCLSAITSRLKPTGFTRITATALSLFPGLLLRHRRHFRWRGAISTATATPISSRVTCSRVTPFSGMSATSISRATGRHLKPIQHTR